MLRAISWSGLSASNQNHHKRQQPTTISTQNKRTVIRDRVLVNHQKAEPNGIWKLSKTKRSSEAW